MILTADRVFSKAITTIQTLSTITGVGTLPRPPVETRMKLYGLYKQATEGDVEVLIFRPTGTKPEDEVARKKWDAWKQQEGLTKTQAKSRYVSFLIDTMHRYATSTRESRELLGELEYLWDSVIQNQNVSRHNDTSMAALNEFSMRTASPSGDRQVYAEFTELQSEVQTMKKELRWAIESLHQEVRNAQISPDIGNGSGSGSGHGYGHGHGKGSRNRAANFSFSSSPDVDAGVGEDADLAETQSVGNSVYRYSLSGSRQRQLPLISQNYQISKSRPAHPEPEKVKVQFDQKLWSHVVTKVSQVYKGLKLINNRYGIFDKLLAVVKSFLVNLAVAYVVYEVMRRKQRT